MQSTVRQGVTTEIVGKNFEEIAALWGKDPWDCYFDIVAGAGAAMDELIAVGMLFTDEHVADCVVFGCHSLGKAGLEVFNRLAQMDHTKNIPAILLLSQKKERYASKALLNDHRIVAQMPLKMLEFRSVLKKLLSRAPVKG